MEVELDFCPVCSPHLASLPCPPSLSQYTVATVAPSSSILSQPILTEVERYLPPTNWKKVITLHRPEFRRLNHENWTLEPITPGLTHQGSP